MTFSSHYPKVNTYLQFDSALLMLILINWLRQSLIGSSTVKLIFLPPFPYYTLWKKMKTCSLHLRRAKYWCMSSRVEYLQDLFGIIPCDKFVSSLSFIYLSIQWFIDSSIGSHIFTLYIWLKPSTTLFYHSNCSSSGHCKLLHFAPMSSDMPLSLCVYVFCCFFFNIFLYSNTTGCSRLTLYLTWVSPINRYFSRGSRSGPFYWIIILETKIWVSGFLVATGRPLVLALPQGDIHLNTIPCI